MRHAIRYLAVALVTTLAACVGPGTAPPSTLTVDISGVGTVTSQPTGIDCDVTCQATFADDTTVILTAVPEDDTDLIDWTGCDTTTDTTCTVTMTSDRQVGASFTTATAQRTLSVDIIGVGTVTSQPTSIDCGDACQATFADGTAVTLTAAPGADADLFAWTGCDTTTGATCAIEMTNDRTVTASFTGAISGTLVFPGDIGGPTTNVADIAVSHDVRGAGRGVEFVPGEVLVRFAPNVVHGFATMQVDGVALERTRGVAAGALNLYSAAGLGPAETLALVASLRARADVLEAFPNWLLHALAAPNDEYYPFQWHYSAANLPDAWDIQTGAGASTVVAVVDTGIVTHPDITANLLGGYDFVDRDDDPTDLGGATGFHGTHVAGTIGATTNNAAGVAGVHWDARIVPVRVLDDTGSGSFVDIIDGIVWAAGNPGNEPGLPPNPNPARVINLSLGGNIGVPCPTSLDALFGELAADGAILVAAAGNDAIDAVHTFPASCSNVITVGATGPANTRAPYSNFGAAIDVMAPGGDTTTTLQFGDSTFVAGVLSTAASAPGAYNYAFYQGTSMAAPHVAGIATLMLTHDPTLSFTEVKARLEAASNALSASACNRPSGDDCGFGLVDAAAALADETSTEPPAPPPIVTEDVPTYVVAFYCIAVGGDPCGGTDFDRSRDTVVPTTSTTVPYVVTGLLPGTYLVAAWQDLDQNVIVDDGEPFGVFPDLVAIEPGQVRSDIDIDMQPATVSATSLALTPIERLERHLDSLRR